MPNINKNIIMQAGAAVANATNKAAGLSASTPEPGAIISAIQLVNGGRTIGPAALAHFTESVRNKLLSLQVSMEPIQTGSGTPSPDNVRPISGRTGLNIYVSPTTNAADANTYAVDWTTEAGTVYGGTLDVVTGVLTVDRALYTWSSGGGLTPSNAFALNKSDVVKITAANQTTLIGAICDSLPSGTWAQVATQTDVSRAGCIWGNGLAFRIAGFTTAEEYRAFLANNPLTFAYLLDTPLTYQLTGTDIVTLVGYNYIWSDSGDVTISE